MMDYRLIFLENCKNWKLKIKELKNYQDNLIRMNNKYNNNYNDFILNSDKFYKK